MTTNVTEVYNWVIRGLKGMPLVAIVEGISHGIIGYYKRGMPLLSFTALQFKHHIA